MTTPTPTPADVPAILRALAIDLSADGLVVAGIVLASAADHVEAMTEALIRIKVLAVDLDCETGSEAVRLAAKRFEEIARAALEGRK